MDSIPVVVKHLGNRHEVELDPTSTGETFKYQLYSLTGVEPERQKILIKGGQLKNDTELSSLKAKPGQTFMMMGTPASGDGSGILERPKEILRFKEDMSEAEQAKQEGAIPAGLQNLGNTCYLNSTLQALRAVPELQEELLQYSDTSSTTRPSVPDLSQFGISGMESPLDLTASLRDLYKQMSETQQGFPPLVFLQALRTAFPQFAQQSKSGHGYAQQDAEEAWTEIVSLLRQKLKVHDTPSPEVEGQPPRKAREVSFVDKYLAGRFESVTECDEAATKEAGEVPVESGDMFLKLDCHIGKETNHLTDGLSAGLTEKLEKRSEALDRNAMYTKISRISKLPRYLTVHFLRFYWKKEVNKKAKIMRKVTFPQELDCVEFCTESLAKKLIPVRDKLREIRKDEEDVTRARKRQKMAHKQEVDRLQAEETSGTPKAGTSKSAAAKVSSPTATKDAVKLGSDAETAETVYKTDAEYDAERLTAIAAAKRELFALIDPDLAKDDGANQSGVYELRGLVTHQGASADSGHYTAYVKKQGALDSGTGKRKEEDGKWWWFNDDRVSEVDGEKIDTLCGGGESHSALILLYRAVDLPTADDIQSTA